MKKFMKNPVVATIWTLVLAFVLMNVGSILGLFIEVPIKLLGSPVLEFAGRYFGFIGIWIVMLGFCLLFKRNRAMLKEIGTKAKGNNVKTALAVGLPLGIGCNLFAGLVAMLSGNIHLYFNNFNPLLILLFIVVITIQSGAEELVCRWFIYQRVKKSFPKLAIVAILLNSLLFSALHLSNPGVTVNSLINIALVGVLYSLVIYYFDSFWACVVAHASWNFCQNILLGLPNSGLVSQYSLFGLDAASATDGFAYSVSFGIEGTYFTNIVLLLAILAVVAIGHRKNKQLKVNETPVMA